MGDCVPGYASTPNLIKWMNSEKYYILFTCRSISFVGQHIRRTGNQYKRSLYFKTTMLFVGVYPKVNIVYRGPFLDDFSSHCFPCWWGGVEFICVGSGVFAYFVLICLVCNLLRHYIVTWYTNGWISLLPYVRSKIIYTKLKSLLLFSSNPVCTNTLQNILKFKHTFNCATIYFCIILFL